MWHISQRTEKPGQTWQLTSRIPATCEAEAGGLSLYNSLHKSSMRPYLKNKLKAKGVDHDPNVKSVSQQDPGFRSMPSTPMTNREEGKEEREVASNNEVHHICPGTRHKETCRKLLHIVGEGNAEERDYIDLRTMHVQV
jgi:hypothetical protein